MKKKFLWVLAALMVVALVGCSPATETATDETAVAEPTEETTPSEKAGEETDSGQKRKIALTTMNASSFFNAVYDGAKSVVDAHGDELIYVDGKQDASYQAGVIEDFVAQNVDIILYNPADGEASLPSLELAAEAGIPLLNYDSKCADMSYSISFVATDNYKAGYIAGEFMCEEHPEGGTVAILDLPAAQSAVDRADGFIDAITEAGNWEIVAQFDGGNNTETALKVAEDIVTAHPDLTAIYSIADEMALGAYSAVMGAGMDTHIYSVNGGPDAKDAMKADGADGIWRATSAQSPIKMGEMIAELAYKYLDGEELEDEYLIEPFIISPANIDEYGNSDYQ